MYHVESEVGLQVDSLFDDAPQNLGQVHQQEDTGCNDGSAFTMHFHISTLLKGESK